MKVRLVEEFENEEILASPETEDNGIANMLIDAINDEWEAIKGYNDLLVMIREEGFDDMIPVIEDISNEENTHVGQLQELLSKVSENIESISTGEKEAEEQLCNDSISCSLDDECCVKDADDDIELFLLEK